MSNAELCRFLLDRAHERQEVWLWLLVEMHSHQHECPVTDPRPRTTYVHPDYIYQHCPTLGLVALRDADHPDYRDEWRLPDYDHSLGWIAHG